MSHNDVFILTALYSKGVLTKHRSKDKETQNKINTGFSGHNCKTSIYGAI